MFGHSYLSFGDDPFSKDQPGWGLAGNEKRGQPPTQEGGYWDKPYSCVPCGVQPGSSAQLKHGTPGLPAKDATPEQIQDCILKSVAQQDYHMTNYNCHSWVKQARKDCGLSCEAVE